MNTDYDIAVIGGGPAGCSAAITAARGGARVVLLEKGAFPRQKVCGEFVSAEALNLLRQLLANDRLLSSAPSLTEACFHINERTVTVTLPERAASITRWAMDSALWQSAGIAGATLREKVGVATIANGNAYRIETSVGVITVRCVIQAAGRQNRLRPLEAQSGPKWIGLKAHYFEDRLSLRSDLYFFPGGYCGVQPIGDGKVNVCAMVRADVARSLDEVFLREPGLVSRCQSWKIAGTPTATAPLEFRPPQSIEGNQLLAGDAAGFIDPFVGDGISMALHSGSMAALVASRFDFDPQRAAPAYATEYIQRLVPAFRNAARIRRLLNFPAPVRAIGLRIAGYPPISRQLLQMTRIR